MKVVILKHIHENGKEKLFFLYGYGTLSYHGEKDLDQIKKRLTPKTWEKQSGERVQSYQLALNKMRIPIEKFHELWPSELNEEERDELLEQREKLFHHAKQVGRLVKPYVFSFKEGVILTDLFSPSKDHEFYIYKENQEII